MGVALVGCDSKQESTTNPTVDGTGSAQALQTTENDQTLAISEEDAKYLQDVEHFGGFVLGDLAFPKINNSIKQQDWETFESFFAPDFEGEMFVWEKATSHHFDFANFQTWTSKSSRTPSLNRTEFVNEVKELRERFTELERSGFKVMQMKPEHHGEFDRPWNGSFKISMAGKNPDGNIAFLSLKFSCRITAISEETPDAKEYILGCVPYEGKYGAAEKFLMEDITNSTGITNLGLRDNWKHDYGEGQTRPFVTGGIFANDFNQDGNTDFLITDLDGLFFYVGDGNGKFKEQSIQLGLQRFIKEPVAVVADFNLSLIHI